MWRRNKASNRHPAAGLFATLCAGLLFSMATVAGPGGENSGPYETLTGSRYWYDGDLRRTVWVDADLSAEFTSPTADGHGDTAPGLDQPMPAPVRQAGIRFWKVGQATRPDEVAVRLSASPLRRFSPVFRDTPSGGGPMRALPGGVIVYLDPNLPPAEIDAWLIRYSPNVVRRLPIGPHVYLIDTPPGLESLETANRIHESGEVIAATPNWWTERSRR